jgi:7,8-dihydroneopterin aldolase/epimerase/oxygenase
MDRIQLNGITCSVHIGVTEEERAAPQALTIDLELEVDLEAAANTDDLNLTVDYQSVVEMVRQTAENSRFKLVESLTRRICAEVLQRTGVASVKTTVWKFPETLRGKVAHVAVEMVRKGIDLDAE